MQQARRGHNRCQAMILGEIAPMSPIAEHIMVMANEIFLVDFVKEIGQLRKLLTGYKIVGPKNRVQPHKSYVKIIKGNRDEAVIIRGPQNYGKGIYDYVYVYPCPSSPSLRLLSAWDSPIRNTNDTRLFFNIYEIPNELYYELQTLTQQWLKQSTTK